MTAVQAIAIALLALATGYAIRRGSICAVLATRALMRHGSSARMRAFGFAAIAAAVVLVPLSWIAPGTASLSEGYPIGLAVLIGGALFGVGARINDACAMGTLAHLTGGRMDYLFTLAGMAGGAAVAHGLGTVPSEMPSPTLMAQPSARTVLILLVCVLIVGGTLRRRLDVWVRDLLRPAPTRFGPFRAMLIVGVCGGTLYGIAGGWTYFALLSERAARLVAPGVVPTATGASLAAGALVAGGILAAWRSHSFRWRSPMPQKASQCLAGGVLMGAAAAIVPGGNGMLLTYGLPSLAPHAIAAYGAMTMVLCLTFLRFR
ncbi:MAG: YeeE/YedE thiosulfate transporter family protein [Pseudomonadota bacterium]